MAYSIKPILHNYPNKDNLHKVYIRIIYNRVPVKISTNYKVRADQFENGDIINHPNSTKINRNIRTEINQIEGRLTDVLQATYLNKLSAAELKLKLFSIGNGTAPQKAQIKFVDFIDSYNKEMKGKKTDGTIAIYASLIPDLNKRDPDLTFDKIDVTWLNLYEQYQRSLKWDINTIHKKMSKIKTLLNRAAEAGHIEEKKFRKYAVPLYVQKIPEYISEDEMEAIKKICDATVNPLYKMAGYYFLLACYAGSRLSDLKKFDHTKYVKGDKIILRAKKNKAIINMPLHTRLAEILSYVKDNPITFPEQDMREYVKDIVKLAGISRHIKIHTGRHSFAMMLMDNGFDLEEVAALLGVSTKTAAIYGHISNKRLESKVKSKLG